MIMDWRLANDQKKWNDFVAGQIHAQFLQSWEWGEFQRAYGRRVWRVAGFAGGRQVTAAQLVEHYLGFGHAYFYAPRGPIFFKKTGPELKDLLDFIEKKIANYGTVFLRIEGQSEIGELPKQNFRIRSIQPAHTMLLDLQKTEGEILSKMHQKTRYNIRLAYKKDLEFKHTDAENFLEEWRLLKATGRRDKISLHPKRYYQLMDKTLGGLKEFDYRKLFVFKNKVPLAVGVFIGWGDTFTYVHGASSGKFRDLMAPYLLQWEAVKYAREKGYKYYDLGGVNPTDKTDFEYRPRWEGISRFKYGFGGEIWGFGNTFDLVLKEKSYRILNWLKKIKSFL